MASYRGRVTAPASRIIGRIPDGDAENDNGASEVQFLRDGSPEKWLAWRSGDEGQ